MIISYMSTLSIPLPPALDEYVTNAVRRGDAASKADLVRRAISKLAEDQAVADVLQAERELAEGKILRGDLRKLAKSLHGA